MVCLIFEPFDVNSLFDLELELVNSVVIAWIASFTESPLVEMIIIACEFLSLLR
jgi:hypothetical protein